MAPRIPLSARSRPNKRQTSRVKVSAIKINAKPDVNRDRTLRAKCVLPAVAKTEHDAVASSQVESDIVQSREYREQHGPECAMQKNQGERGHLRLFPDYKNNQGDGFENEEDDREMNDLRVELMRWMRQNLPEWVEQFLDHFRNRATLRQRLDAAPIPQLFAHCDSRKECARSFHRRR